MPARICCLDLDTFFVSVERLLDPSLVGKPVVVGAAPGSRGVVTAASYEVRALGVRAGMSAAEARRLAPDAVFVPTRHGAYGGYAKSVRAILERYTPDVQTASIDEFFLDFRGCESLWRRPSDVSDDAAIVRVVGEMRAAIQAEVGLPASAGIGAARAIAKIASALAKPAGTRFVAEGSEHELVAALPVRRYPGIGPVAEARLVEAGVRTLGALLTLPPGRLRAQFGGLADAVRAGITPAPGRGLGRDRPAFREHDAPGEAVGSISNERTFRSDLGVREVDQELVALVERVGWRARQRQARAGTVTVKLKYADFVVVSRSRSCPPTSDEAALLAVARELVRDAWGRALRVRLVGVALSGLVGPDTQLDLPFARARPAPAAAIDAVRARFGYDAIRLGATGTGGDWSA